MAACCYTAPVHVYVPPPHVVVVPHVTHFHPVTTTRVNPVTTTRVNPSASAKTLTSTTSTLQTVHAKPTSHPRTVQPIIVDTQTTTTSKGCKQQQTGQGCKNKKDDDQTAWAKVRRWLQGGKQ